MLPLYLRRPRSALALLAGPLLILLALKAAIRPGPAEVGAHRAEAEVLSIKTITLKGGPTAGGVLRSSSRHVHARVRLDDGGEAVLFLQGMTLPRVGARIHVTVTEFDDGSRRLDPVIF